MTASEANRTEAVVPKDGAAAKAIFNDGKAHDALRTIGEVTKALGIRQHVLRYWEEQFPALQPIKRSGNRRYYRPEDVALIADIDRLVNREGYTLRGAGMALGQKAVGEAAMPLERSEDAAPAADAVFADLRRIRNRLALALAAD
ncbi:MerR family transcriptional regulator [Novosphingobium lindaniclasticum]|uniref:HTH merR-type domain-containing protein n=1 Tax=Novosphingobium lindaniclasticum LE124 TaxID=1096930 RepID=T0IQ09_9SPHN|nr:MerR family transcriptional regulator [Novosphingobium lindaniclasticum]EQB13895.1 hypothetical protein L284_13200 [Novosphingobium lindaniclasticum LE124]